MKNNLVLLTKVLIKGGGKASGKKGNNAKRWLFIGLLALAFMPMIGQMGYFTSYLYDILVMAQMQGIILSLALTLSAFVIFFFGIFYVMNTFYFTNDIESLLPLPVRPFEILGAKFIVVTVYEYLTELIVVLPVVIVYGVKDGAGPLYYIYTAVIFLILPIIPLVLASLIIMPLMRFTNLAKNKDRFRYFGGIIALAIGLGINIFTQRSTGNLTNPDQIMDSVTQLNNSLDITTRFFPSSKFGALGLINSNVLSGFTNMLLFLAISAAAVILFLYLGEKLYFKGVMGVSEVSAKRKKIGKQELEKQAVKNPVIKTYFLKEIKLLVRTPIYFMNCVIMNFIWPVFIVVIFFAKQGNTAQMSELAKYLDDQRIMGIALAVGFGFILFLTSSNGITSTSISREGQNLYIAKYIPVSYKDQIFAKVLSGVFFSSIGMLMMVAVGFFLFKIPVYMLLLLVAVGIIAIILGSFFGIVLDLFNPKLNWENEQKAVKQNMNLIINMLICVVVTVICVAVVALLEMTLLQTLIGILVIFGIADFLLYVFLSTKGAELFSKLEN
jgi:ABC-2 type transport system permease protein